MGDTASKLATVDIICRLLQKEELSRGFKGEYKPSSKGLGYQ